MCSVASASQLCYCHWFSNQFSVESIPSSMQGRSLLPFLTGATPGDCRDSFLFSYNIDPEFPMTVVVPHIGLRRSDGLKIVNYSDEPGWNELYDTSVGADTYEIINQFTSASHPGERASLTAELVGTAEDFGFLKVSDSFANRQGGSITMQAGDASLFRIEKSPDLLSWQTSGTIEGGGT